MNRAEAREKARALVARMTLEEKASQLRYDAPAIERLGIPAYNWWNEALHGVARGGTATSFPQAIGLAATFDDALLERLGKFHVRSFLSVCGYVRLLNRLDQMMLVKCFKGICDAGVLNDFTFADFIDVDACDFQNMSCRRDPEKLALMRASHDEL